MRRCALSEQTMESNTIPLNDTNTQIKSLVDNIEKIIFGKREAVSLCVVGLLARGHILIEDVPGIGKTTLAQGLARSIDCNFNRIQFTNDMLPTDILGVSILNPHTQDFDYREGPIFANVVLPCPFCPTKAILLFLSTKRLIFFKTCNSP